MIILTKYIDNHSQMSLCLLTDTLQCVIRHFIVYILLMKAKITGFKVKVFRKYYSFFTIINTYFSIRTAFFQNSSHSQYSESHCGLNC